MLENRALESPCSYAPLTLTIKLNLERFVEFRHRFSPQKSRSRQFSENPPESPAPIRVVLRAPALIVKGMHTSEYVTF